MTQLPDAEHLILAMRDQLSQQLEQRQMADPVMVGIHSGGAWVGQRLHQALGFGEPLGTLDIAFYRDDFSRIGVHPQVRPSHLPFAVEGRNIILVDDVLYTGRTVRAALNELFDYGRPAAILLAVLVDRRGRELPVAADVVGHHLELAPGQQVKLDGPKPLKLTLRTEA